jgi:Domain of unknown function (DUF4082)
VPIFANPGWAVYQQTVPVIPPPVTYRFFPSTSGPVSSTGFGGTIIVGTLFKVTAPGLSLQGYWYWRADTAQSASPSFALWQATGHATGTLVAATSVSGSGAIAGQWNFYPLTTPAALTASTAYKAVYGVTGNFLDTPSQFNSGGVYQAGITTGSLFAFSDHTGTAGDAFADEQSTFDTSTSNPAAVYPIGFSSGFNGWVDVQVG